MSMSYILKEFHVFKTDHVIRFALNYEEQP